MKSKIEVRKFAVEKAVAIMGVGTPDKDVVAKAKEIEAYVLGGASLPEVSAEEPDVLSRLADFMGVAVGLAGGKAVSPEKGSVDAAEE